ncbi:hypothetical protein CHARACLAT_017103 [Characodon lateralis]|uniref:Uncharacterized protein n=1 Tax=Characodon lateralis TaxID=208331 RepID=A0ABU7DJT9_9TELE|nr:hypothetical protein [Characodon lateralis]
MGLILAALQARLGRICSQLLLRHAAIGFLAILSKQSQRNEIGLRFPAMTFQTADFLPAEQKQCIELRDGSALSHSPSYSQRKLWSLQNFPWHFIKRLDVIARLWWKI